MKNFIAKLLLIETDYIVVYLLGLMVLCSRMHGQYWKVDIYWNAKILWRSNYILVLDREEYAMKAIDMITRRTIYIGYEGMDCDCCCFSGVSKYDNIFVATKRINQDSYDAEGPYRTWRISKAEYLERKGIVQKRDLVMEGYENGDSYSLRR